MQGKCFYYFVSLVCSKIFIGQQCHRRGGSFAFEPAVLVSSIPSLSGIPS